VEVNNNLPTVQIVSEVKINLQSLNQFMKKAKISQDWNDEVHKRNLNTNYSDVEKIPEAVSALHKNIKTPINEFNIDVNEKVLKSIPITLGLNHVSKQFIFELNQLNKSFEIFSSDFDTKEISFWANPCLLDKANAAYFYGNSLGESGKRVDSLIEYLENSTEGTIAEKEKASKRLIPVAAQVHCFITGSLFDWMKSVIECTDFDKLDEMRFIFIEITRKLKLKYSSLFFKYVLCNSKNEEFGLDTVNSIDNGWRNYKVVSSRFK
jgi:hypothetical protein